MEAYYAMQWPRENLFCTGYIHEVMNFRYNWHETEYELNILLHGRRNTAGTESPGCWRRTI